METILTLFDIVFSRETYETGGTVSWWVPAIFSVIMLGMAMKMFDGVLRKRKFTFVSSIFGGFFFFLIYPGGNFRYVFFAFLLLPLLAVVMQSLAARNKHRYQQNVKDLTTWFKNHDIATNMFDWPTTKYVDDDNVFDYVDLIKQKFNLAFKPVSFEEKETKTLFTQLETLDEDTANICVRLIKDQLEKQPLTTLTEINKLVVLSKIVKQ